LAAQGFALALDDFEGASELLEHCGIVKVAVTGRADDDLSALIAAPAERGLELVATGVATADEFTRCRVLGFSHFQGEFFARPSGEQGTAAASLQSLRELTSSDLSFEDLEEEVLETLPFSEEISGALLRHEGPLGEMLAIVLRYEQGHLPASGDATELAEAYLAALKWADRAGWWVG